MKGYFNISSFKNIKKEKEAIVLILGGDGTLNYLINNISTFKNIKVLYFPSGTANDFARSLRLNPVTPSLQVVQDILENSALVPIPIMKCNDKRFINVVSAGAPANVTQSGSDLIKEYTGKISYYISALEEIVSPQVVKIKLSVNDSSPVELSLFGFAILQGLFAGGGVKLSPNISANFREKFEFTALTSDNLGSALTTLLKIQKNDVMIDSQDKNLITYLATKIVIESNEKIPAKLDGEEYHSSKFEFKKEKEPLNFFYY